MVGGSCICLRKLSGVEEQVRLRDPFSEGQRLKGTNPS